MSLTTGHAVFLYEFESDGTRIVCPLAERLTSGHVDAYTPYGCSGFAGNGGCPEFPAHWRAFAIDRGYVCGYIGLNPLFYHPSYGKPCELYYHHSIYVLDLRLSEAELFTALSLNRKRSILKSARLKQPLREDRASLAAFFVAHFRSFMSGKNANATYELSEHTLEVLAGLDNVLLVGAGNGAHDIEAVAAFAHTPHSADYLFGIWRPNGKRHSVALLWNGMLRLKALGIPWLNLGGGIRPGDGVAEFKARFGARELPLGALKQVYDEAAYAELCRTAGRDPNERDGYFPAYRAEMGGGAPMSRSNLSGHD